jgi:hypothetical protein
MTTITVSNNEKIPASNAVTNTRAIYSSQSRQRAGMALRVCLIKLKADARSGVSTEDLVHALDRHSALAHRRAAALYRAEAHVARSEDAWHARLQRPRRTAYALPRGRVDDRVAGFDEAIFIALDLRRQPSGAWLSTNHRKDGRRLHGSSFVRLRVLQLDGFENLPAYHFPNLGVR